MEHDNGIIPLHGSFVFQLLRPFTLRTPFSVSEKKINLIYIVTWHYLHQRRWGRKWNEIKSYYTSKKKKKRKIHTKDSKYKSLCICNSFLLVKRKLYLINNTIEKASFAVVEEAKTLRNFMNELWFVMYQKFHDPFIYISLGIRISMSTQN